MAARLIPRVCAAVFVAGLAGLIISSIAGNNEGVVLLIGGCISLAAIVLIAVNATATNRRIDAFVEADAERLEQHITALVADGADEGAVRRLVGEAIRIGSA